MPKVDKPKKAATVRAGAHPTSVKSASSKKKKKTASYKKKLTTHGASLGDELDKAANPGKLKPIKGQTSTNKTKDSKSSTTSSSKKPTNDDDDMEDDAGEMEFDDDEDGDEMDGEDADESGAQISARMSKKILEQAHAQQREELEGEGEEEEKQGSNSSARRLRQIVSLQTTADGDEELSDADEDGEEDDHDDGGLDEIELSAEDQASLEMFMPKSNTMKSKSLADVLFEKMRAKEIEVSHGSNVHFGAGFGMPVTAQAAGTEEMVRSKLDPKIVEVYTKVGKFLSHYTSGKVPKAFKLIPNLKSWEEILFLTQPDAWSVQSYFIATRIFSSNFNPKMAQRFYSLILLPKIRNDIESNKHLNFHLYQAIKKSLYKPAAFFKGLLLPLAEEGASARESVIMSSILAKCTIPVLHSSVALLKLSQMPYSGTSALFIRTLLNKKYSLPRKVLSSLVQYFCSFLHKSAGGSLSEPMPLIWHQTLLAFIQRYKYELTANQVTALKNLIKVQSHHSVTQEIRRELAAVNQPAQPTNSTPFQFSSPTTLTNNSSTINGGAVPTQTTFSFGLTPGFTSLAAAIKNPTQFQLPQTTSMEQ